MPLLPTGTVTFLFTDIEGSTQLARKFPDGWPNLRARHYALLKTAITMHRGKVFQTVGDEIDAAFETAQDGLAAALAAQYALQGEDWADAGSIRVRMGLHTGPAALRSGAYEGYLTLSHAKRLMSVAHGGQILVSEATGALLVETLPDGVTLVNLGGHRLKDFEHAEQIYQVAAPDLPTAFPAPKTMDGSPNNLPAQLTSFIGRAKEVGEVKQLLSTDRLLTLTGPGGSGKTRLALQAAAEMTEQFQDGVFFIALAPITDPGLVPSTIAKSLGITETPGRSIFDSLKDFLQKKTLLLVLDNFEQVIAAATLAAELLMSCGSLKMIITSREGLRIRGEREYPVSPLALPDLTRLPPLDSLLQYTAVDLFLQRAKAVRPDFQITKDTAQAVAEICYRLDGLPLAIELAAARIKLLPPRAMLARLEHSLEFLTGGPRDQPARQQTLRNAIAWSYDLLNEYEKCLFRRLAIFVSGCTLEAVEAVSTTEVVATTSVVDTTKALDGEDPSQVAPLDQLGSLLDKSLLQEVEGLNAEPRFVMLETLREFGLEQLKANGELDMVHRRHAAFFLALAEQAEATGESAGQVEWMNRMEQEHGNLRAALEWSRTAASATSGDAEICLRLAVPLALFWEARGYYSEGRDRLAGILETGPARARTAARARLLARAAELAYRQSDYPATAAFAGESLAIYREVGDRQGIASTLLKLGNAATEVGEYAAASGYLEEALATWRALEDRQGTSRALISFGWAALRAGDYPLAEARLAEALAISRDLGDTRRIGFELSGLGEVALRQGNTRRAAQLVEESLELRRQLGNKWGIGVSLGILGSIAMDEGNWELAAARLGESLEARREIGDLSGCAWCLERLAETAMAQGNSEKAVRLFGAGEGLRASISSVIDPADRSAYETKSASLRAEFGEERFLAAWEEGRGLALDQSITYALVQQGAGS